MADEENVAADGAILGPGSHPASSPERIAAAREHVALTREIAAEDRADRQAAEGVLREQVGDELVPGLRVVNQYLDSLPAEERDAIENRVLSDGRRALNDANYLVKLGLEAIGPLPRDAGSIAREIAKLEGRIRSDRKGWNADEKSQMRLRLLYRARDGQG